MSDGAGRPGPPPPDVGRRWAEPRAWARAAAWPGAIALVVLAVALGAAPLRPHAGPDALPAADDVVIVVVPRLSVRDLGEGRLPTLDQLARTGSVAAVATRNRSARPSVPEAYLSLSAGSRVRAVLGDDGRYRAAGGVPTRPGAFGDALQAGGAHTAVIDGGDQAPLADVLADSDGQVDDLVTSVDVVAQRGGLVQSDPDAVAGRLGPLLTADHRVVLIDTGDTERAADRAAAAAARSGSTVADPTATESYRRQALGAVDRTLAAVAAVVAERPGTLLAIVGVTPPDRRAELSPLVLHGAGVRTGTASSLATDRPGVVVLTDLTPSVIDAVGGRAPAAMTGRAIRLGQGDGVARAQRVERIGRASTDAYEPSITSLFVVQTTVLVGLGVWLVATRRRRSLGRAGGPGRLGAVLGTVAAVLLLAITAWPLATFLVGVRASGVPSPGLAVAATWAVALAVGLLAFVAGRRRSPAVALLVVASATVATITLDVATGGRLDASTVLGHTALAASRFYGVGNAAFGGYAAAALVAAATAGALVHDPRRRTAVAAAIIGVVLVVDVAPGLGADFGGVLALLPAGLVLLAVVSGLRVRPRTVTLALGAVLLAVVAAVGADLLRPAGSRTHVGQLASDTLRDPHDLWDTITRKWSVNVASLHRPIWTRTIPAVVAALVATTASARRRVAFARSTLSGVAFLAVAVLAVVGFLTNDSGLLVLGVAAVWLAPLVVLPALATDTGVLAPRPARPEPPVDPFATAPPSADPVAQAT